MSDELFKKYRRDRDPRTFERLVESHLPLMRSICRRFLRDPNDVEDVVQETILKLTLNVDAVTGSVSAWLAATAQAASIDLIRRSVRERNRRRQLGHLHAGQQIKHLAAREAVRLRLHEAMLAIEPAAAELIAARFIRKTPLRVIAGQRNISVPTASREVTRALGQLVEVLRGMGVPVADVRIVADHFGVVLASEDFDDASDHGALRFAPDWRSAELTPLGAEPANTSLLPGWSRPLRVGALVSYDSTIISDSMNWKRKIGIWWQVRSTTFFPHPGIELVAVVDPGSAHRGIVESTLRDHDILGGLIEADDAAALATLDVLLIGINFVMSATVVGAITQAVRGGVGLINEFWTGHSRGVSDATVPELLLAESREFAYHMAPDQCGIGELPATVVGEHPVLPGLKSGTTLSVRGCGPAYRVVPSASVLITKDLVVSPQEHGIPALGPLQMPCFIVGHLGRGRVAVNHIWPPWRITQELNVSREQYFTDLVRWLAAGRLASA